MKIFIRYIFFILIAITINLVTQWPFFILIEGQWAIYLALIFGTLAGLLVKYILDKRWIFYYSTKNTNDDIYRFTLYSVMGLFTTVIFWGTEIGFYYYFNFKGSQYLGGALGLIIGYSLKYILDKRFVFKVSA